MASEGDGYLRQSNLRMQLVTSLKKFGVSLKPFFNLKVENWQDALSLILGLLVLGIVLFQSYFLEINYDEAYTYLNTGRYDNVWQIYQFRIANTHFLNSLLMSITTLFFPYNDVAIRLPAILFAAFFISTSISFSKAFKNRFILLGLLFFFYFFTMYLSMARGYGMSAACVMAMIFVYYNKPKFENWFLTFSIFALLAMYGNYVAIPIILVFGAYIYAIDFKFSLPPVTKKTLYWLIGIFVLGVYGFYSVTKAGKPLYGAFDEGFWQAIPMDWLARFIGGYVTSEYVLADELGYIPQLAGPLFILLIVGVISVYFFGGRKNVIGVVTITTLFLVFVISELGSKPLPTGRVLLPFWPLIVVTLIEVLEYLTNKLSVNGVVIKLVNLSLLVLIMVNYTGHFNGVWSKDRLANIPFEILVPFSNYEKNFTPQDWYYDSGINEFGDKGIRPEAFYVLIKERRDHKLPALLEGVEPSQTDLLGSFKVSEYKNKKLITLNFTKEPVDQKIDVIVLMKGDTVFQDEIRMERAQFTNGFQYPVLLPYPTSPVGDELVLKSTIENWERTYPLP